MNHIRQGQNNNNSKRSRGRGRKPQNSGNRTYDSNGPDVKIRGTATHVCEKYQQLARDAITSGDRVMAENYYQHAEHYYRLIMANQTPNDGQPRPQNALGYRPDEDQDYDEDDAATDGAQPQASGQPFHQQNGNQQGENGGQGQQGQGRNRNRNRNRDDRNAGRTDRNAQRGVEGNDEAGDSIASTTPVAPTTPVDVADAPQPVVEAAPANAETAAPAADAANADADGEAPRRRPVRRRRPRADAAKTEGDDASSSDAGADEVPA